jgi:hypothetical protein
MVVKDLIEENEKEKEKDGNLMNEKEENLFFGINKYDKRKRFTEVSVKGKVTSYSIFNNNDNSNNNNNNNNNNHSGNNSSSITSSIIKREIPKPKKSSTAKSKSKKKSFEEIHSTILSRDFLMNYFNKNKK